MIFTKVIKDPYNWHSHFTILPVIVDEQTTTEDCVVITQKLAVCQQVERQLQRNMTGTEKWLYRIPVLGA